jgi:hypothetical protein
LFLRRLQPLAQALDVFIVRLVLLLVHFQQRPQDFDAMPFLCHTLSVFELAYNRTVSGCFDRFTGFYICVWLNVVLGVGGKLFAFRDFSSLKDKQRRGFQATALPQLATSSFKPLQSVCSQQRLEHLRPQSRFLL